MTTTDRTVDPETLPYRPCVGIMVLNRAGLVWAGRRIALAELYEETGMRSVSLLAEAPDWIDYDLPPHLVGIALKGRYRGQTQKWFAFRFEGDESEIAINPPPGGHEAEFDAWGWKRMETLPELIVPFKRRVYEDVVAAFRHLAG
jgi:putative (di)nucleoside polyphosphate hydrolase